MKLTLAQLAERCGAQLDGDERLVLEGANNLREATADQLSLYSDRHYTDDLARTQAGAVITTEALAGSFDGNKLIVSDPLLALARAINAFEQGIKSVVPTIAETARIASSAQIGTGVQIAANAVIGDRVVLGRDVYIGPGTVVEEDTRIGQASRIDANVTIYHGCTLGRRCQVSAGAVIGSDGFGFAETRNDSGPEWVAIPQIASVRIGDDVHIGANTTIDRGSLEDTVIEDGVIIDNLVQIAHNVKIGRHTAIAGCAGIAGSARIGKNCKIGGRASILGHIDICDNAVVFAVTYVTKSITQPGIYSAAMPAMPLRKWQKTLARFRRGVKA